MAYKNAVRFLAKAVRLAAADDPKAFEYFTKAAEDDDIEKVAVDLENEADKMGAPAVESAEDELMEDEEDEDKALPPEEVQAELRSIRRQISYERRTGELSVADARQLERKVAQLEAQVEDTIGHDVELPDPPTPPLDPPSEQTVPSIRDVKARLNTIARKAERLGHTAQASALRSVINSF